MHYRSLPCPTFTHVPLLLLGSQLDYFSSLLIVTVMPQQHTVHSCQPLLSRRRWRGAPPAAAPAAALACVPCQQLTALSTGTAEPLRAAGPPPALQEGAGARQQSRRDLRGGRLICAITLPACAVQQPLLLAPNATALPCPCTCMPSSLTRHRRCLEWLAAGQHQLKGVQGVAQRVCHPGKHRRHRLPSAELALHPSGGPRRGGWDRTNAWIGWPDGLVIVGQDQFVPTCAALTRALPGFQ